MSKEKLEETVVGGRKEGRLREEDRRREVKTEIKCKKKRGREKRNSDEKK